MGNWLNFQPVFKFLPHLLFFTYCSCFLSSQLCCFDFLLLRLLAILFRLTISCPHLPPNNNNNNNHNVFFYIPICPNFTHFSMGWLMWWWAASDYLLKDLAFDFLSAPTFLLSPILVFFLSPSFLSFLFPLLLINVGLACNLSLMWQMWCLHHFLLHHLFYSLFTDLLSNGSPPRLTTWKLPPLNLQEYWLPLGLYGSSLLLLLFPFLLLISLTTGFSLMAVFPPSPPPPILLSLYPYRYLPCQECYLLSHHTAYPPWLLLFF